MPYPTPHRPKPSQLNFIWQFVVIALLIMIGAAVLVQNWQINLAVTFLGMTSVALPLSLLMAIAFGSGLIVAWTISAVNTWANANRSPTGTKTTPRWGSSAPNDPDAPSTKPKTPQNPPPQNKPPTQVANQQGADRYDSPAKASEPPQDTTKAQTASPSPSPSPSPRVSMRDSQRIAPDPAPTPQPIKAKRSPSPESDWIDESEEWESEDEWEEEYDDDWDEEEPDDDEPEDPDTVPYGKKRTNSKSSKSKRPPLQAKYIRW